MENVYLNLPTIKFNGITLRNLTELNTLPDIPEKYYGNEYVKLYLYEDDRLIENLSYELYDTTKYWDLLLKFNGIINTSLLPVNNDILLKRARKKLDSWIVAGATRRDINIKSQYEEVTTLLDRGELIEVLNETELVKIKYLDFLKYEIEKNEKYRNFKYLSLSDISELEMELLSLKTKPKLPEELIVIRN
jgi:hypothetical protein